MKDVRHDSTAQEQGERAEHPTEPSTAGRFLRGLTLGALVGAAIAGSAIWDRRRKHDEFLIHRITRVALVDRHEVHAADRAFAGFVRGDPRVHRRLVELDLAPVGCGRGMPKNVLKLNESIRK